MSAASLQQCLLQACGKYSQQAHFFGKGYTSKFYPALNSCRFALKLKSTFKNNVIIQNQKMGICCHFILFFFSRNAKLQFVILLLKASSGNVIVVFLIVQTLTSGKYQGFTNVLHRNVLRYKIYFFKKTIRILLTEFKHIVFM